MPKAKIELFDERGVIKKTLKADYWLADQDPTQDEPMICLTLPFDHAATGLQIEVLMPVKALQKEINRMNSKF